jgi:hypothetical protein
VSAVQISHHEEGHGYRKRLQERGFPLQTVGVKAL